MLLVISCVENVSRYIFSKWNLFDKSSEPSISNCDVKFYSCNQFSLFSFILLTVLIKFFIKKHYSFLNSWWGIKIWLAVFKINRYVKNSLLKFYVTVFYGRSHGKSKWLKIFFCTDLNFNARFCKTKQL